MTIATTPPPGPPASGSTRAPTDGTPAERVLDGAATPSAGLGVEVRDSLLLLTFALAVTVGLSTVAQAALAALS